MKNKYVLLLFIKFFADKNATEIEQTIEFRTSEQNGTEIGERQHK